MEKLAQQQRLIAGLSNAALNMENLIPETEDEEQMLEKFDHLIQSCKEEECINDVAERAILAVENYIASSQQTDQSFDDDLLVTETTESYKDPLTKLTIKDPVKSRTCNHSYERSTILKFLEKARKCPHSGCIHVLSRVDLMDDLELKRKLLRIKNEDLG